MQTRKQLSIPDGFERVDHHDPFTLHNDSENAIIMVHERDGLHVEMMDKYPYKVTVAKDQKSIYDGVFDSKTHAIEKAKELAHDRF